MYSSEIGLNEAIEIQYFWKDYITNFNKETPS